MHLNTCPFQKGYLHGTQPTYVFLRHTTGQKCMRGLTMIYDYFFTSVASFCGNFQTVIAPSGSWSESQVLAMVLGILCCVILTVTDF